MRMFRLGGMLVLLLVSMNCSKKTELPEITDLAANPCAEDQCLLLESGDGDAVLLSWTASASFSGYEIFSSDQKIGDATTGELAVRASSGACFTVEGIGKEADSGKKTSNSACYTHETAENTSAPETTEDTSNNETAEVETPTPVQLASPAAISFNDDDKYAGQISGTISLTKASDESSIEGYTIYYGSNSSTKLTGANPITTFTKNGSNQTFSVSAKTLVPAGATHLLAYGYADSRESSTPASAAISDLATGVLVLFSTGESYSGNLGGRSGADSACSSRKSAIIPSTSCSSVKAFISTSTNDSILKMPDNYGIGKLSPIKGPTGITIANNWQDLLDGSLATTLSTAQLTGDYWWSGSNNDGTFIGIGDSCQGFTTSSMADSGRSGVFDRTSNWATWADTACDIDTDTTILCLCY